MKQHPVSFKLANDNIVMNWRPSNVSCLLLPSAVSASRVISGASLDLGYFWPRWVSIAIVLQLHALKRRRRSMSAFALTRRSHASLRWYTLMRDGNCFISVEETRFPAILTIALLCVYTPNCPLEDVPNTGKGASRFTLQVLIDSSGLSKEWI